MAVRGLGKGLDSLIPDMESNTKKKKEEEKLPETFLNINSVEPNRDQPRKKFDEDALQELSDSIKQYGLLQPILVQQRDNYYEIIAGERRWRAAKIAGLKEVPVIIKHLTDQEIVEISLIENIQRENLNPIEEAMAYKRLLTEFNLKHDELAERVSKNRTTITNSMRLLKLNEEVQQMVINEMISPGHARALLAIEDLNQQYEVACKVFDEKLSVRDTEKLVKNLGKPTREKKITPEVLQLIYKEIEDKLRVSLGVKIGVIPKDEQKGKIEIDYYSQEELERIVELLTSVKQQEEK
ncbi:ParB/RepB/Spo0J family partition protein [bacterium C-53]|nr:ParB/RepB/Spo0J family partition protein [Lachnospiraceae bacterium]NBI03100.1 ParB/RepB/Spo0J family partition protein [Lachnospiraceae bacterium]RKJ10708.1 ParB/RepB/Spo0J family partition protein [bacterium C-53]